MGEADQIIAYAWTAKVPAPGALLRSEPLPADLVLDNAATSLRILYSSTDGIDGKTPIAVSGALFVPKGRRQQADGRSSPGRMAPSARRPLARRRFAAARSAT
ncbi:MAG TPA: hypothetical protein VN715_10295 [Roseiarcus sp.]|nr:hypothetical protein [Roseiarcus sp.]